MKGKQFTNGLKRIYEKIREEYGLLVLLAFFLSTALMIYQHSLGWSWDFDTYSMIGSYLFHDGFYMEWLRPPLASTIMGLFQFVFSRTISEYAYITLASLIFLYSSKKLAKNYGINHKKLYILLLTPGVIYFSNLMGTEMLSLALVMLFLADLDKKRSGLWLGLAFLTRYNLALLIPLVLFQKDVRKMFKTLLTSLVPILPWLLYNWAQTRNPLTSFGNFLIMNVFLRYKTTALNLERLLLIILPTALLLLVYFRKELRKKEVRREELIILGFAALIFLFYLGVNYRYIRYLYPMILPVAFFSTKAWSYIGSEKLLQAFLVINIIAGGFWIWKAGLLSLGPYQEASGKVGQCMVESERWIPLNYAGKPTKPALDDNVTMQRLEEGYRSVSFKSSDYRDLSAPVIEDNKRFTLYGFEDKCAEVRKVDGTYLEGVNKRTGLNYSSFIGYMTNETDVFK